MRYPATQTFRREVPRGTHRFTIQVPEGCAVAECDARYDDEFFASWQVEEVDGLPVDALARRLRSVKWRHSVTIKSHTDREEGASLVIPYHAYTQQDADEIAAMFAPPQRLVGADGRPLD